MWELFWIAVAAFMFASAQWEMLINFGIEGSGW